MSVNLHISAAYDKPLHPFGTYGQYGRKVYYQGDNLTLAAIVHDLAGAWGREEIVEEAECYGWHLPTVLALLDDIAGPTWQQVDGHLIA